MTAKLSIAVVEGDPERARMIVDGLRDAGDYEIAVIGDVSSLARRLAALAPGVSAYVVGGLSRERVEPVMQAAIARFHVVSRLRAELAATKAALEERKLVDRAKGMLMKAKGISEEEAYGALRRTAMAQGKKVADVAQALITAADLLR